MEEKDNNTKHQKRSLFLMLSRFFMIGRARADSPVESVFSKSAFILPYLENTTFSL